MPKQYSVKTLVVIETQGLRLATDNEQHILYRGFDTLIVIKCYETGRE